MTPMQMPRAHKATSQICDDGLHLAHLRSLCCRVKQRSSQCELRLMEIGICNRAPGVLILCRNAVRDGGRHPWRRWLQANVVRKKDKATSR